MRQRIKEKIEAKLTNLPKRLAKRESSRQESNEFRRETYQWLKINAPWKLNPSK